jgi:di/tricarboxylate transporter
LSVLEIFTNLFYALFVNLLESLVFIAAPLFLAIILPLKWFRDKFVSVGGILVILFGAFLIYFTGVMSSLSEFSYSPAWQVLFVIIFAPVCAILLSQIQFVEKFVSDFADRAKVFLFLLIPMSLLSTFIILFRNLL